MTKAGIVINGKEFHVDEDGGNKKEIKKCLEEYVNDIKKKVKAKKDILEFVLKTLESDAYRNEYAWIIPGTTNFVSYLYSVEIKKDKIKIRDVDLKTGLVMENKGGKNV